MVVFNISGPDSIDLKIREDLSGPDPDRFVYNLYHFIYIYKYSYNHLIISQNISNIILLDPFINIFVICPYDRILNMSL